MERFYDVSNGIVTIDNVNIKELNPKWLRGRCIGFINQEPILFATTIMENIRCLYKIECFLALQCVVAIDKIVITKYQIKNREFDYYDKYRCYRRIYKNPNNYIKLQQNFRSNLLQTKNLAGIHKPRGQSRVGEKIQK